MELVSPGIGLVFWMTLSFAILLWILSKYAWKPIMKALHERESSIDEALNSAKNAKEEMEQLKFSNEQLLKEAAKEEAEKIVEAAKDSIQYEKMAAITELKNQIGSLSIEIAEKILKEELSEKDKHNDLIRKLIDDVNFN